MQKDICGMSQSWNGVIIHTRLSSSKVAPVVPLFTSSYCKLHTARYGIRTSQHLPGSESRSGPIRFCVILLINKDGMVVLLKNHANVGRLRLVGLRYQQEPNAMPGFGYVEDVHARSQHCLRRMCWMRSRIPLQNIHRISPTPFRISLACCDISLRY